MQEKGEGWRFDACMAAWGRDDGRAHEKGEQMQRKCEAFLEGPTIREENERKGGK